MSPPDIPYPTLFRSPGDQLFPCAQALGGLWPFLEDVRYILRAISLEFVCTFSRILHVKSGIHDVLWIHLLGLRRTAMGKANNQCNCSATVPRRAPTSCRFSPAHCNRDFFASYPAKLVAASMFTPSVRRLSWAALVRPLLVHRLDCLLLCLAFSVAD